jgi:hypothetical protein
METNDITKLVSKDLIEAGYNVATNKQNTLGLKQFHTHGVGNSVPDLFFWNSDTVFDPDFIPDGMNTIRAGFVELKTGNHIEELLDGVEKNSRYYGYFISEKAIFTIDGNQIHNVDCFLFATGWSRTGMIYKGDDSLMPQYIRYISDRYDILIPPYTIMVHSVQRQFQKLKRVELRNMKIQIKPNKLKVETGIMFSKIPFDVNLPVTYEYYAWLGNRIRPVLTVK